MWKINCHYSLWEVYGLSIQFYNYVLKLSSFLENNFLTKYYWNWWRKWNKYMFCQNWEIVYLQQVLNYGCLMGHIVINFLGSNSKPIYKWLLGCLNNMNYWLNLGYQIDKITCSIWIEKFFAYVRYEGLNLRTMIYFLKLIIKCEVLGLIKVSDALFLAIGMLICCN